MKHRIGLWLSAVVTLLPARAFAESAAPAAPEVPGTAYYIATMASSTLAVRPAMGPITGPQRDATVGIGVGRSAGKSLFVELDASATFVAGVDPTISLVPAIGWAFHPNVYAAFRTSVPVEHPLDVTLAPGVGALRALDDSIAVFAELDVFGATAFRDPDVGLALTVGATVGL